MLRSATFDPARRLDLYFRLNRSGNKRFIFIDSSGDSYDISGIDFQLFVSDYPGARQNRISLTIGSGLSVPAYEDNILDAEVTADQTPINEGEYYWELYVISDKKTWLCGKAYFHNGEFDGVGGDTDTLTISEYGEIVQVTISI